MEEITKTNIGTGAVGVLAVLSLILAMGGAPDAGNWYYGIDNQSNIHNFWWIWSVVGGNL